MPLHSRMDCGDGESEGAPAAARRPARRDAVACCSDATRDDKSGFDNALRVPKPTDRNRHLNRSWAKNLSLSCAGPANLPKNLSLSSDPVRS